MPSDPGWFASDLKHEEDDNKNNKNEKRVEMADNKQAGNKTKSKQPRIKGDYQRLG